MYYIDDKLFKKYKERTTTYLANPDNVEDKRIYPLLKFINRHEFMTSVWGCESHPEKNSGVGDKQEKQMYLVLVLKKSGNSELFLDKLTHKLIMELDFNTFSFEVRKLLCLFNKNTTYRCISIQNNEIVNEDDKVKHLEYLMQAFQKSSPFKNVPYINW